MLSNKLKRLALLDNTAMLLQLLARGAMAYPRITLVFCGALTFLGATLTTNLHFNSDGRALLPEDHPALIEWMKNGHDFPQNDEIVVVLASAFSRLFSTEGMGLLREIDRRLQTLPGVAPQAVHSLLALPSTTSSGELLELQACGSSEDAAHICRDAMVTLHIPEGVLAAADDSAAVIIARLDKGYERTTVLKAAREALSFDVPPDWSLYLAGPLTAQGALGELLLQDLLRTIPVALFVVGLLLYLFYRSPLIVFGSLLECGISIVLTAGILGLTGGEVYVSTLVLPVLLLAVGVADDIFLLDRIEHAISRLPSDASRADMVLKVREIVEQVAKPVAASALTTIAGLLSLLAINLNNARDFGSLGSLAILLSTIFTFSLLPALALVIGPHLWMTGKPGHQGLWSRLAKICLRIKVPAVLVTGIVLVLVLVAPLSTLKTNDSWAANLPASESIRAGDHVINEKMAGTTRLELVLRGSNPDWLLNQGVLHEIDYLEHRLATYPRVGAVYGPIRNLAGTRALLHMQSPKERNSNTAVNHLENISAQLLMQATLYERLPVPTISRSIDVARIVIFFRNADYQLLDQVMTSLQQLKQPLARMGVSATITGDGWLSYLVVKTVVEQQWVSLLLSCSLVTGCLWLILNSLRIAVMVLMPVILAVMSLYALLAYLGIPLGIATSMFACIVVGLGVDYATHLTIELKGCAQTSHIAAATCVERLAVCIRPVLVSAGILAAAMATMMTASVPPNRTLGLLIGAGALMSALLSIFIVPALIVKNQHKEGIDD